MPLLAGVMGVHPEASFGFISWICDEGRDFLPLMLYLLHFVLLLLLVLLLSYLQLDVIFVVFQVKRTSVSFVFCIFLFIFLSI